MQPTIIDTDILSEILRGRNPVVLRRARAYRAASGPYAISVLTAAEVTRGLQKANRDDRVIAFAKLLDQVRVIPLDRDAAMLGGRIAGDLDRTGQTIGLADPLIAAVAIENNLVLTTGNTRHYQRIIALGYNLQLDDWRQELSKPM